MNNFYHEIPLPEDKAIRKFLWISYFHDGLIEEILFAKPKPEDVTLRIYSGHDGFTYLLRFHSVPHFEWSTPMSCWHAGEEISSTVFKDSALLHRLEKEQGRPLYHLRVSFWDGYMDIVFAKFSIRREGARVSYKSEIPPETISWQHCRYTPNGEYLPNIAPFEEDLASLPADEPEDQRFLIDNILWARLYRLEQLDNTDELVKQARYVIAEHPRCEHTPVYAAFLLGKYGTSEDMPPPDRTIPHRGELIEKARHPGCHGADSGASGNKLKLTFGGRCSSPVFTLSQNHKAA